MRADHKEFNLKDSVERINQILEAGDNAYEEHDGIPARYALTFTNGFFVKCSAIFVDIRRSIQSTDFYLNRALAKLYRTYVSEFIAVMNGCSKCAEINVVGDGILGVFDTPSTDDINEVFTTAARISSIVDILNYKFKKKGLGEVSVGIGISYGKALVVKTGYKGSAVGEVMWMGEVINEVRELASFGNKESTDREIMVSELFYYNLDEKNKKLLTPNLVRDCYHGDVLNQYFNLWYKQNCP